MANSKYLSASINWEEKTKHMLYPHSLSTLIRLINLLKQEILLLIRISKKVMRIFAWGGFLFRLIYQS